MQWQQCGTSFQETLIQNAINETGYYHIKISNISDDDVKEIKNNRDIQNIYQINNVGYAKLQESQNKDKPYVEVYSMNTDTFNDLKFNLIQGRFATNSDEIVISDHIRTNGDVDLKVGDEITFEIGKRVVNGYELDDSNPYIYYEQSDDETGKNAVNSGDSSNSGEITHDEKIPNGAISHESESDKSGKLPNKIYTEELQVHTTKTFKIVGVIERPEYTFEQYSAPGYTVITTNMNEGKICAYLSLNNPSEYKTSITELLGANSYKEVLRMDSDNFKYSDYEINEELLRWQVFAFSDSTVSMLTSVIGVVIFIIIFTSVFCIRNSFAISVTEKTKMYGMLSSVGATKKQIKKNVVFEGLVLAIIGIPIGIICGLFAVYVLLKIVNSLIGEYLLSHVDGIIFSVSFVPILLSIILGIVTIYISSISSAKKASKVSPIENVRNTDDIKIKNKKLKTPKIIYKIFKTGGVLAYKNLKRNKKKYRTTVVSLAISIFVFITMNVFLVNAFDLTGNYYEDYDYNFKIRTNLGEISEEQQNKIISYDSVQDYFMIYKTKDNTTLDIKDLSKINNNEDISTQVSQIDNSQYEGDVPYEEKYCSLQLIGLDNNTFKKYCKKIKVDYEKARNKGILIDNYFEYNENESKEFRRYNYKENDVITGEYNEQSLSINIAKITDIRPYGYEKYYYRDGFLVVNIDEFKDLDFELDMININSNNNEGLADFIQNENKNIDYLDLDAAVKEEKAMVLVVKIFLYGFITVITLIGVTNIFNTITSNMELRQKEFAMLKSIGMTKKEFDRMINLETLFYGTKSWIYGVILGLFGTFELYKAFSVKINSGIYIPVRPIIISAIFVFILVFFIMKYSIGKINKQNTIETIRKENI